MSGLRDLNTTSFARKDCFPRTGHTETSMLFLNGNRTVSDTAIALTALTLFPHNPHRDEPAVKLHELKWWKDELQRLLTAKDFARQWPAVIARTQIFSR